MADALAMLNRCVAMRDLSGALATAEDLVAVTDQKTQASLARALYEIGRHDPAALSVFLAAHAHTLPRSTIFAAGKALPEAG
ncbi:MAG: DNA alkylation repair protein [Pseudomonadota bacterium]